MTLLRRGAFLAAPLLLWACTSAPRLSLTAPEDGMQLGPQDDLDPAAPGLQIEVDADTSAADGSVATALGGGPPAKTFASSGKIRFPSVTLDEGSISLVVSVIDAKTGRYAVSKARLLADSMAKGCRFTNPAADTIIKADPGDTGLVAQQVDVFCRGLPAATPIGLTVGASEQPIYVKPLGADGTASFSVQLQPGENLVGLVAQGSPLRLLRLRLLPPDGVRARCTGTLSPATGTVFNLAGGAGAVADRDPAQAGMQARLTISGVPERCEGEPARIAVSKGGAGVDTQQATVSGGAATFDLTLPEGAIRVEAFVGATGGDSGALRPADYLVDSQAPSITLLTPIQGQVLGDADNVSNTPGTFAARFSGVPDDLDAAGAAWLAIDEGAPGAALLTVDGFRNGSIFKLDQPLANGLHTVRAYARRASGNLTASPVVAFSVVYLGAKLAFASPQDGDVLGLAQLTPQTGGATATFQLLSQGLAGGSATVRCTSGALAVQQGARIGASGAVSIPLFLPLARCDATPWACTATGAPALGSPVTTDPIHVTADATAPGVVLTAPLQSGNTRSGTFDLHAVTDCAAEPQTWTVTVAGQQAASGRVGGNAVDALALPLNPGANLILLTVTDAAGNAGHAGATLTLLPGTPQIVFTQPADGATLHTADDADAATPGLQTPIRVQVDNRPSGTQVDLVVSTAGVARAKLTATTAALGGHLVAVFPSVTLPEGAVSLAATVIDVVIDPVQPPATTVPASVTVSTGRPICNILVPPDGTSWTGADDSRPDLAGFQHPVRVQTDGTGTAVKLTVTAPDGSASSPPVVVPAAAGVQTVTFADVAFGADGRYLLDAICDFSGPVQGRAVTNAVALSTTGPSVAFVAPQGGGALKRGDFDASGAAAVQLQITGADGGFATLVYDCGLGPVTLGPATVPAGGALSFAAPLVADGQEATCSLTASARTASGTGGLPAQIAVLADRSVPAPAFAVPQGGGAYGPTAPELDCSVPSAPRFKAVSIALADPVGASGLALKITSGGVTTTVASTPAPISGGWAWSNVDVPNGSSSLTVTAVDAAGNASAPITAAVAVRCLPANVSVNFVGYPKLGYQQDQQKATPGEQAQVSVSATVANGSPVRVCACVGACAAGGCSSPGYAPLAVVGGGTPTIQASQGNSTGFFQVTLPEGPQTVVAEVTDVVTEASPPRNPVVRSVWPTIQALSIQEDANSDGALNQAELDAAGGTVHFVVEVAAGAYLGGAGSAPVQIFATGSAIALGSVTLAAANNGAALTKAGGNAVSVPVALAALAAVPGYPRLVFYALVQDDAGNPDSTPSGFQYPGDPPVTLGTAASPFVFAPAPTVSLTAPASSLTKLLARDDSRCAGSPPACPGVDPLRYVLSATTSAPDGSQVTFLLNGAALSAAVSSSGHAASASEDLANGAAQAIAARVADPYGNVVTSAPVTLLIDSVLPVCTITSPADGSTQATYPFNLQVTCSDASSAGDVLTGQTINIQDGTTVGSAVWSAGGNTIPVFLSPNGPYVLTATITDSAGNTGVSAPLHVTESSSAPQAVVTQPAAVTGTAWFNLATKVGTKCQPALQVTTANTAAGTVRLFAAGAADCSGTPSQSAQLAAAGDGAYDFTGLLTFADGETGWLCPQVTVGVTTVTGQAQAYGCDLATPTVAFASPASGQGYVAFGQSVNGAIASLGSGGQNDATGLWAVVQATVTAVAGSVVSLYADGSGTPVVSSSPLAGAASAQTVTLPAGRIPVPAGAASTAHTLSLKVVAPSGNPSAEPTRPISADVYPPDPVAPGFTVKSRLAGVVGVTLSALPGEDGSLGSAPAWDVCASASTALTSTTCPSSTLVANNLAGAIPGPTLSFDLLFPTDQPSLFAGVRGIDRMQNLGGFTDQSQGAPSASTALTRASVTVNNADAGIYSPVLRVADVDGDGFDDVVLAYPNDAGGDGRVYVWFGGSGGIANPAAPMTLPSSLPAGSFGLLGNAGAFDVADVDGDGIADVIAAETDCAGAAIVNVWTGARIQAARQAATTPQAIRLDDTTPVPAAGGGSIVPLLGGTVRAVGRSVSGGSGAGRDLLITNYTAQCPAPATLRAVILPAGGGWLADLNHATLGAATAGITLPSDANAGVDAAAFTLHGSSTRDSVAISVVASGVSHDLKAFSGDLLSSGASVAWASGVSPGIPAAVLPASSFGLALGGGRDAVGDTTTDLVVADPDGKQVLVYDGAALLTAGVEPLYGFTLGLNGDPGDVGRCAVLLPDLDGDGKAEFSGCADVQVSSPVYFGFGYAGAAPPWGTPILPTWKFVPARGQRIEPLGAVFGQAVSAGKVTSSAGFDLVVLSHSSTGHDRFWLIR